MKTTTNTGKNEKITRKVPVESAEAIKIKSSALKIFLMTLWKFSSN